MIGFVGVSNPAQAKSFYRDTLGLTLVSEDQFALVFNAAGTMLRVSLVAAVVPASYTVLGWQVDDIAETIVGLAAKGVTFERYGFMQQDQLGIWQAPGGTKVAWFKDPDGNLLSVSQFA
ncbi:MAG: VOC family protein [Bryobacteraceae bacterium]